MGKAVRPSRAPKTRGERVFSSGEKLNPFEQVQNKKFKKAVLGKQVKGSQRDVAKSTQQALKERTSGLLDEYKNKYRTSEFRDKRIGKGLDEEAAAGLRLAKERKKQAKKQKFTLPGSADGLTVGSVPIGELDDKALKAQDLSDVEVDDAAITQALIDADGSKSRREVYAEVMAQAKQRKIDEAREKEEQEAELQAMDGEFQDLVSDLQFRPSGPNAPKEKQKPDEYSKLT